MHQIIAQRDHGEALPANQHTTAAPVRRAAKTAKLQSCYHEMVLP